MFIKTKFRFSTKVFEDTKRCHMHMLDNLNSFSKLNPSFTISKKRQVDGNGVPSWQSEWFCNAKNQSNFWTWSKSSMKCLDNILNTQTVNLIVNTYCSNVTYKYQGTEITEHFIVIYLLHWGFLSIVVLSHGDIPSFKLYWSTAKLFHVCTAYNVPIIMKSNIFDLKLSEEEELLQNQLHASFYDLNQKIQSLELGWK